MKKERFDSLRMQYRLIESKWRFLQGLRYGVFAFLATSQIALFSAYQTTLTGMQNIQNPTGLGLPALRIMPILALLLLGSAVLLELRLRDMYATCSSQGRDVEAKLLMPNGIFSKLHELQMPISYLTHTGAFYSVMLFITAIWLYLLLRGVIF